VTVYLINPSHVSFGIGVITPRWLYVLASATPGLYGEPRLIDETLETFDLNAIQAGDVVGIGIHTGNALRGYEIGRVAPLLFMEEPTRLSIPMKHASVAVLTPS
jgi:hypothetical protein